MKQKGTSWSAAAIQTLSQTQTGLETPSPSSGTGKREVCIGRSHRYIERERGKVSMARQVVTKYDVTAC